MKQWTTPIRQRRICGSGYTFPGRPQREPRWQYPQHRKSKRDGRLSDSGTSPEFPPVGATSTSPIRSAKPGGKRPRPSCETSPRRSCRRTETICRLKSRPRRILNYRIFFQICELVHGSAGAAALSFSTRKERKSPWKPMEDATMTLSQRNTQVPAAIELQTISMDQVREQVRRARIKRQAVVAQWICRHLGRLRHPDRNASRSEVRVISVSGVRAYETD